MKRSFTTFAVCLFAMLFTAQSTVIAAPPQKAAVRTTIHVTVPEDAEPVTFTHEGEVVTVLPGETEEIPANASDINLTEGSYLTIRGGNRDGLRFDVVSDVTLTELDERQIIANEGAFAPVAEIKHPKKPIKDLILAVRLVRLGYGNPANLNSDGN